LVTRCAGNILAITEITTIITSQLIIPNGDMVNISGLSIIICPSVALNSRLNGMLREIDIIQISSPSVTTMPLIIPLEAPLEI